MDKGFSALAIDLIIAFPAIFRAHIFGMCILVHIFLDV